MQKLIDNNIKTLLTAYDEIKEFFLSEGIKCKTLYPDELFVMGESIFIGVDCVVVDARSYEVLYLDEAHDYYDVVEVE